MKRILVVDDDRMNCVMAKGALKEQYEVYTVNSGEEALAFLEQQEPVDMILMDIMKALDMLSGYLDGLSEYAEMSEEELNEMGEVEDTIRTYIVNKEREVVTNG